MRSAQGFGRRDECGTGANVAEVQLWADAVAGAVLAGWLTFRKCQAERTAPDAARAEKAK